MYICRSKPAGDTFSHFAPLLLLDRKHLAVADREGGTGISRPRDSYRRGLFSISIVLRTLGDHGREDRDIRLDHISFDSEYRHWLLSGSLL